MDILVVEDDKILNMALSYNLKTDGYTVVSVFDIKSAKQAVSSQKFNLIVLDVNLPDGNGFDLCCEIKKNYTVSIIFLTANDMESDMIKGFESGAEDYVTKPFPIHVFQRKVKVILDRMRQYPIYDIYKDSHLELNFSELCAKLEGETILFTPKEYKVLNLFTKNAKILLTKQTLLENIWDIDEKFVDEHTLATIISRIRGKIEKNEVTYIKTVYGLGYMWVGEK